MNNSRDATVREWSHLCYELDLHPGRATKQEVIQALHTYVHAAYQDEDGLTPAIAGHRYDAWRGLLKF